MTKDYQQNVLALVGIGNTIAGDDAAGIVTLEHLQKIFPEHPALIFLTLPADLYEVSDHLDRADHFIFIDAVAGSVPGQILRSRQIPHTHTPSFHQTDIGAVMVSLERLQLVKPFPSWEVWGITILPPTELSIGLSATIQKAVRTLGIQLAGHIRKLLQQRAGQPGGDK